VPQLSSWILMVQPQDQHLVTWLFHSWWTKWIFIMFLHFPLLIFSPPLLWTHLSPHSHGCDGPDKRAHYHINVFMLAALHVTLHLVGCRVRGLYSWTCTWTYNSKIWIWKCLNTQLQVTGYLMLQQYSTTQYNLSNKESWGQKYWGPQIKDTKILQLCTHIMQYILRHIHSRVNNRLQVSHKWIIPAEKVQMLNAHIFDDGESAYLSPIFILYANHLYRLQILRNQNIMFQN
jgi:hypothetical protein